VLKEDIAFTAELLPFVKISINAVKIACMENRTYKTEHIMQAAAPGMRIVFFVRDYV
jgi:hypothetical protein